MSFTVNAGEIVALVGPSGGGKSSCMSLLEHFYEPTSGEILLDGVPIRNYSHKYLHTKVCQQVICSVCLDLCPLTARSGILITKPTSFVWLIALTPLQSVDRRLLRFQIALVGQEPVLYARSVRDNIAYGLDTFDDEDVKRVAVMANAHTFVTEAKEGYDTQVGEKGVQMSGKWSNSKLGVLKWRLLSACTSRSFWILCFTWIFHSSSSIIIYS